MERITVTSVTYEGVRAVPYRFIVAPSDEHFFPDVEEIVERHSDYWIVDKQGEAKEVATRMSQRAAS